jgi:hypothetical protein
VILFAYICPIFLREKDRHEFLRSISYGRKE